MDAFIGEVRAMGFNWCPQGWLPCDGTVVSVQQYPALYAILGNTFGGTPRTSFGLPKLNGQVVSGAGQGPGLQNRTVGEGYGSEQVALTLSSMPNHTHVAQSALTGDPAHPTVPAPGPTVYLGHLTGASGTNTYAAGTSTPVAMSDEALAAQGSNLPHENRQPYLVLNYVICWDGMYPPHP